MPVAVDTYPRDVSVYGVRGAGGNAQDWCADLFVKERADVHRGRVVVPQLPDLGDIDFSPDARRVTRGGLWHGVARGSRCAYRWGYEPSSRSVNLGFRLSRTLPPR